MSGCAVRGWPASVTVLGLFVGKVKAAVVLAGMERLKVRLASCRFQLATMGPCMEL